MARPHGRQFHVAHSVPGRIRLRIPKMKNRPGVSQSICRMAAKLDGVTRAEPNSTTGSMVIHYDPQAPHSSERLKSTLERLNELIEMAVPEYEEAEKIGRIVMPDPGLVAERVPGLKGMERLVEKSDEGILKASHGAVDLATILPLLLAGGGLMFFEDKRHVMRNPLLLGGLLLLSFKSFMGLHQEGPALTLEDKISAAT